MPTKTFAIILVLLSTLLTSSAQIFYKFASQTLSFNLISVITNTALIIGLILYGIAAVMYIIALKYGELSVLFPIIATSYIWVSLASPRFFATDSMNLIKWFAITFIAIGVIFIGVGSRDN